MSEQYASPSCLSCLLDSRRELEPLPEPFRLQQDMTFRVTLSAYTEYILSLPDNASVKLMSRIDTLKSLASIKSPRLYNCFLKDMSMAMLKEISYAEEYGAGATVILPASMSSNVVATSYLLKAYGSMVLATEPEVRETLYALSYALPKAISQGNKNLFNVAVILYRLSMVPTTVKEMHFLYDTAR